MCTYILDSLQTVGPHALLDLLRPVQLRAVQHRLARELLDPLGAGHLQVLDNGRPQHLLPSVHTMATQTQRTQVPCHTSRPRLTLTHRSQHTPYSLCLSKHCCGPRSRSIHPQTLTHLLKGSLHARLHLVHPHLHVLALGVDLGEEGYRLRTRTAEEKRQHVKTQLPTS